MDTKISSEFLYFCCKASIMQQKKVKTRDIKKNEKKPEAIQYHRKPINLSLEAWQIALRKQFVAGKNFTISKFDGHPVFCDYSCDRRN